VPTAHHGRRPISMPTAEPMPTAIWPVPTPSYADGDVPTVAVGTGYADGIFSCADGRRPSAPCLRPVVKEEHQNGYSTWFQQCQHYITIFSLLFLSLQTSKCLSDLMLRNHFPSDLLPNVSS
jgi:hypothetical protein